MVILILCYVSNFAKYRIIGPIFTIITIVIPSYVLFYLCGAIWKRRLDRLSNRNMKNLAIYFPRIILSSFVVTFIPGDILFMIAYVPFKYLYSKNQFGMGDRTIFVLIKKCFFIYVFGYAKTSCKGSKFKFSHFISVF